MTPPLAMLVLSIALAGGPEEHGSPAPGLADIERALGAGRPRAALEAADEALRALPSAAPERAPLLLARSRCLFELGDWEGCEGGLRQVLESPCGSSSPEARAALLVRRAECLSMQDSHEAAERVYAEAAAIGKSEGVLRIGMSLALRARDPPTLGRRARELLELAPRDPFGHFARGIALSRRGDYRAALPELRRGLELPGAERDARFELALALAGAGEPDAAIDHLLRILEKSPRDQEACHQLARQLIRARRAPARVAAAHVIRYLEALKAATGPSSRVHHLRAAGRAAEAALEAAARAEAVGDLEEAVRQIERAGAFGSPRPDVARKIARFWLRQGLLAEAEALLAEGETRRAARAMGAPSDPAGGALSAELARRRRAAPSGREGAAPGSALQRARERLRDCRWTEAAAPLEDLLRAARQANDEAAATAAARLLLAREPRSRLALKHLAERARGPDLAVARLHYLARQVAARAGDEEARAALGRTREFLSGR